jgi:ABC-type nitrate/sulfonate/bicarbonate transport system permease component
MFFGMFGALFGYVAYRFGSWTFDGFTLENFLGGAQYVSIGLVAGCVVGLIVGAVYTNRASKTKDDRI